MDHLQFQAPANWFESDCMTASDIIRELKGRYTFKEWKELFEPLLGPVHTLALSPRLWAEDIFYVQLIRQTTNPTAESLDILGRILCQALRVPQDCCRGLEKGENHNLLFFTNFRAIQVYCYHSAPEKRLLDSLLEKDLRFRVYQGDDNATRITYHQCTELAFDKVRPYIVWECIYPEGIDMEALSPRDVNAHIRMKPPPVPKAKPAIGGKLSNKEKDHPPPPPEEVKEPPSSDRKKGAVYKTGRLLGRGGFAICYEAQLAGTKHKYALKIVKSHMPQKKMEQKVAFTIPPFGR